jgi:hypothetical protein
MGPTRVAAVADHARDTQPTISQSVPSVDLLASEAGDYAQHSAASQHRLL